MPNIANNYIYLIECPMKKHENLNLFFIAEIILWKILYRRNSQSNDDMNLANPV